MNWLIKSLQPLISKYKIESMLILASALLTLVSGSIFLINTDIKKNEVQVPKLTNKTDKLPLNKNILVDLSGAVEKTDVYEVTSGARLKDILILAGGLSRDADREFFAKNFNLARVLRDQEKIYIPSQAEILSGAVKGAENIGINTTDNNSEALGKVNINTANMGQLEDLPGIGEVTAQKIIQNRPYSSIEDLLNKKSVGNSLFEKIKELITLN